MRMSEQVSRTLSDVPSHILAVSIINLDNIAKNYAIIKKELPNKTQIMAILKADAYGFGAARIGGRLYREGCKAFFVATIEEGIDLRKSLPEGAQIYILSGLLKGGEDLLTQYALVPVLNNPYQSNLWIDHAKKLNKKLDAVVHVDTGISRNGYSYRNMEEDLCDIKGYLNIILVMSHLACADIPDHPLNVIQLGRFRNVLQYFGNFKGCLAATEGIFLGKEYFFDAVRPGKALYGFSVRRDKIGSMIPVMDVFTRIVQINNLKFGDSIGYDATFTADRSMTTITVGMGYADGFMRKFSGFGYGFLGGKKIPMVGRISMDYMVFDATEVEEFHLKIGNWVALTADPYYTLEKWALELSTLPHEIACRFGSRVKRVYLQEEA
ncbi:MAG: alanine racemase [Holosporaceae bacterium]|jgi:alanine racemase|nr:alanine racemase [Holosporaceae bacterium]